MPVPKILIVHYDPRALEHLRKLLEENGFQVSAARDGASALATFLEDVPDLVLLEAMLPKVHGFEVCSDLKKTSLGRKTPVLVMSTIYKGRKYRNEAIHTHGADEYIEMPLDDSKFLAVLKRFISPDTVSGIGTGA
ncbi:MAG: PleD family two-component system response regulator [Acidobacteriota bacterium]